MKNSIELQNGFEKRKNYVDYIKAIGIILVILGHINFANDIIKEWIYAFHMPLFFFATGLITKKDTMGCGYFLKKFQVLIVPYFIWGLIYSGWSLGSAARIGYGSYSTISSAGSLSSLWFIPTMFVAVVLCQLVFKLTEKMWLVAVMAAIMLSVALLLPRINVGYPWCVNVALLAAAFILGGYMFEKKATKVVHEKSWIYLCIVGIILTLTYRLNPIVKDSYVLMADMHLGNPVIFLFSAGGGCLLVYGIARMLERYLKGNNFLTFVGKNTLVIFLVHKPIIDLFERFFRIFHIHWTVELVITAIGTLICSCVMCMLINRFAPCLAGKMTATTYCPNINKKARE